VSRLLALLDVPIRVSLWAAIAAGVLMMLHVTADVTMRTVFNAPIEGTTEVVAGYYMVAIAYLPWAFVARNDNHIVAGIFKQIGTPAFDYWVEIGVKILTIAYVAIFTYQTFLAALQRTGAGEVWLAGTKYLPIWPTRWLLPFAGVLMIAHLILRVIADLARGRGNPDRNGTASPT
jgi:TRAP-type C4-dicarboxylate transport system permease small subunit